MAAERTTEKLARSARGEDRPINEKRPETPAMLVGGYVIALVAVLLLVVLWITLFGFPGQ